MAQIKVTAEEAKTKYGAVGMAQNEDLVVYFKKPSRLVLGVAMAEIDRNVTQACEYIFDDCVIKEISDWEAFRNDDELFIGLIPKLQSLASVKKSTYTTL